MAAVRTRAAKSQTPSFGRPEPEESLLPQFRDHGCAHLFLPAKTNKYRGVPYIAFRDRTSLTLVCQAPCPR